MPTFTLQPTSLALPGPLLAGGGVTPMDRPGRMMIDALSIQSGPQLDLDMSGVGMHLAEVLRALTSTPLLPSMMVDNGSN